MTDATQPNPKFPEQNADGVDLSLIRERLRLDPWERVRRNFKAMKGLARVRRIARRVNGDGTNPPDRRAG